MLKRCSKSIIATHPGLNEYKKTGHAVSVTRFFCLAKRLLLLDELSIREAERSEEFC